VRYIVYQLEILSLQLQEVTGDEVADPGTFAATSSLQRCLELCKMGTDDLHKICQDLEDEMKRRRAWGALKVVLKKDTMQKVGRRLEMAKSSLHFSYTIFSK